jgi:hypothetical protein
VAGRAIGLINCADWSWFGGWFTRPLRRYRFLLSNFFPLTKARVGFVSHSEVNKKGRQLRRPKGRNDP